MSFIRLFFLIYIAALCAPVPVNAAQPLLFSDKISLSDHHLLGKILSADVSTLQFSYVDLNGDGYNELITKPLKCQKTCAFTVFGRTLRNDFVTLATINARDLNISDDKTLGIRNILAQDKSDNDFATSLYIWDTLASRYILKE